MLAVDVEKALGDFAVRAKFEAADGVTDRAEPPTLADFQPQADVRVVLDPAGHPFCLYLDEEG